MKFNLNIAERNRAGTKWRPAKLKVIADFTEDYARELRAKLFIEEQEKIENCYRDGELRRRISNAQIDIWYLPSLAKNDVTKFEEVRKVLFIDAVKALEVMIGSIQTLTQFK